MNDECAIFYFYIFNYQVCQFTCLSGLCSNEIKTNSIREKTGMSIKGSGKQSAGLSKNYLRNHFTLL